jgi:stage V sporulation protein G
MEITQVKVFPVDEEKLKAYVSIVLDDCFLASDLKVIHGPNVGAADAAPPAARASSLGYFGRLRAPRAEAMTPRKTPRAANDTYDRGTVDARNLIAATDNFKRRSTPMRSKLSASISQ